ncbi:MAG: glycosylhydrolase-like jelly roll fold domain-containing protein, partial [Terracidiphilus sp.]
SEEAASARPELVRREETAADLSHDWNVTFGDTGISTHMDRLVSWSDDAKTQFFSGTGTYERTVEIRREQFAPGARFLLDFGTASTEPLPASSEHSMRAYLDPPVREAAEVFVNGKRAGVIWRPPYRADVTALLRPGSNDLRIVVGNTAINELAGQALPDYRLLWARYGMRFVPQDMKDLHPLPSGVLGPVKLVRSSPAQ